jgi:TorA maturation chaperone TorD
MKCRFLAPALPTIGLPNDHEAQQETETMTQVPPVSLAQPGQLASQPTPEDAARAGLYALLARLFYAGPDQAVLDAIADADGLVADADTPLSQAWRELRAASRSANPQAAADEYISLFVGVGKSPVSVYASHYLTENYKELTLVHLRGELERLGLSRKAEATEPEDHLAALLDIMRHLVQRNDSDPSAQVAFFNSYLKPWYGRFCSAIETSGTAAYYKPLAHLMKCYFAIEVEVFEWTV